MTTHIAKGELDEAKAELTTAKNECGKASEYAIDRLERAIQREELHRERDARLLKKTDDSPLGAFMHWVRTEREEKNRAKGEHACATPTDSDYGFCLSKIAQTGAAPFEVRYWKAEPDESFMFIWRVGQPLSCVDTGPHRVVDTWTADGVQLSLCELTEHDMRGLKALLRRRGNGTKIQIFSSGYLRRDKAFASELEHLVRR